MKKEKGEKKERTFIFSEEVDRNIGGSAVGLAFFAAALFLMFNQQHLINEAVTTIVRWVLLLFGIAISTASLLKNVKCNSNNLAWGFVFGIIFFVQFIYLEFWWARLIGFLFLFLALFFTIQEMSFIVYGMIQKPEIEEEGNKKKTKNTTGSVLAFVTTILGLGLVAIQILQQLEII